jgi:hypothetical protein
MLKYKKQYIVRGSRITNALWFTALFLGTFE